MNEREFKLLGVIIFIFGGVSISYVLYLAWLLLH